MTEGLTYAGAGLDYDPLDRFKRMAQDAARGTEGYMRRRGAYELPWSRGESAYLYHVGRQIFAHVEEGLGTKNLVADEMHRLTGKTYYAAIAQDVVAMVVNDMITLGTMPVSFASHVAVGSTDWFGDEARAKAFVEGMARACLLTGCTWGGGETPALKDIIIPGTAVLSGSAVGVLREKDDLINPRNIRAGQEIVFITASGIHANGLTLARKIASRLPDGYLTRMHDGRQFGEALLDPTPIYVPMVERCLDRGIPIAYAVNVTGHGWRKLMRAPGDFAYVLERVAPFEPTVFQFMQTEGPVDDREAYSTFNMGIGFAVFVEAKDADRAVAAINEVAGAQGVKAFRAGYIEASEKKKVVIQPRGIEFAADTLQVR